MMYTPPPPENEHITPEKRWLGRLVPAVNVLSVSPFVTPQESLVEQTTLATALPGEDANHKMASLERNYNELQVPPDVLFMPGQHGQPCSTP